MLQHKDFKKACVDAYGSVGQKARKLALAGKLQELGIDPDQIRIAKGNKASRNFPPHVCLVVTVAVDARSTTDRLLRIAENLRILEDYEGQTLKDGSGSTVEERRIPFADGPYTLDFYDAKRNRRT